MESVEYEKMFDLEDSHWWFVAKRKFAAVTLSVLKKSQPIKILDIGCGTGRNLQLLSSYGQVHGVDFSPLAVKYCHQRGFTSVRQGSAEKLPYKSASFNLITFFDVLYHQGIKSDTKALSEAYRTLKPKGWMLITDCAHPWLYGPHDVAMHARQRYSKKELERKVKQAGFAIQRSSYAYCATFIIFALDRLLGKNFSRTGSAVSNVPPIINSILMTIYSLETFLYRFINLPFGSSIIILAQK